MTKYLQTEQEKELAKEVWQAMDGCNTSGLLLFWANKVLPCINAIEVANDHPFHILMADKLLQLAGSYDRGGSKVIGDAYDAVARIVLGGAQ